VLLATRAVAGEALARRAAPFLVLSPAVVWVATSGDAFFAGVAAWAVALTVLAVCTRGRRSDLLAAGGGLLFGYLAFLSYGLVLLALIPLAVAWHKGRLRPLAVAGAGVLAVMLAFAAAGYSWIDGFFAIRREYLESRASVRPYEYFVVNNLAAFAVVIGPVAAVGLARLRDPRLWLLTGGALAAVALADISGMSKAEVERIWLPFAPWVLLAAAALPATTGRVRALLAVQALVAIVLQVALRTAW
jgi:hypothetical protein